MVVLDGGGMLTSGSNQYLQPDYLSPLPTTLDAKKSPLALLAQTCSQIGADSPSNKSLLPPLEKPKKEHTSSSLTAASSAERASADKSDRHVSRNTPTDTSIHSSSVKLAFKPYENNPISRRDDRPASKVSVDGSEGKKSPSSGGARTPAAYSGRKSHSPSSHNHNNNNNNSPKPSSEKGNEKSESPHASSGASPIIRSGLEILQGHASHKDLQLAAASAYKANGLLSAHGLNALSSLCAGCPPGLESATNPAFRPPFPGFPHGMLAAGYPPAAALGMTPYMSYARVKTPAGGETLVPVCKDPYCTGCQLSMHNAQLLAVAAAQQQHCPSGCTQCEHHKYGLAAALSLMQQSGPAPPPLTPYSHQLGAAAVAAAAAATSGRPYVCSWIAGENYCGKRFATSDELLQHLRSHTAAAEAAGSLLSQTPSSAHPLLSQRYPNPPLSPLSAAARYHPYSKPAALPPALASPFSAFNPTAMGPYYPYSLYGPRLGTAVHP